MRFRALDLALSIISSLRSLLPAIRQRGAKLAGHIRDAVPSIALNLAEGNRRQCGSRHHLWGVASGSAEEVRCALRVAVAWGYLREDGVAHVLRQLDHLQAVFWKLTR